MSEEKKEEQKESEFSQTEDVGIVKEFFMFLYANKLWWMLPIVIVLALLIGLITLGAKSGAAAPFIYTLF